MANLSFVDQQTLEDVFNMRGGYFLDFTDLMFEQFMSDVIGSKYVKIRGLSKAKCFRKFIEEESNVYVGKAIVSAINYMIKTNKIINVEDPSVKGLYKLGCTMMGRKIEVKEESSSQTNMNQPRVSIDYDGLKQRLMNIELELTPQAKGYAFERYLNEFLFKVFNLSPRSSYKTDYDQIDGSISLNNCTILIEAKYRRNLISKDDLILFSNKIETNSHSARGLFITNSNVDQQTIEYYKKRGARLVVLTVQELFILFERHESLNKLIEEKFRYLDETGCIYKSIMDLM